MGPRRSPASDAVHVWCLGPTHDLVHGSTLAGRGEEGGSFGISRGSQSLEGRGDFRWPGLSLSHEYNDDDDADDNTNNDNTNTTVH